MINLLTAVLRGHTKQHSPTLPSLYFKTYLTPILQRPSGRAARILGALSCGRGRLRTLAKALSKIHVPG